MGNDKNPAIELLIAQIDDLERKANAYRASVNVLCEKDGLPPMFPDGGDDGGGGAKEINHIHRAPSKPTTHIKPDTFYGKAQQTAVREFLGVRKANGDGPAKPGEILAGLKAGGYQVKAKTDDMALVGLRAMLRKRTAVFHKLPNGSWGLREWYPTAKPHKETADKGVVKEADALTSETPNVAEDSKTAGNKGASAA